jgi:hypothetical protein
MSSAQQVQQEISGTFATDHSIALAGILTNVTINTLQCQYTKLVRNLQSPKANSTFSKQTRNMPESVVDCPFRRDPDFVDRGDIFSRVDERCLQRRPIFHSELHDFRFRSISRISAGAIIGKLVFSTRKEDCSVEIQRPRTLLLSLRKYPSIISFRPDQQQRACSR